VVYTVTVEKDSLVEQRAGRPRETPAACGQDAFFRPGTWRAEKIFERDRAGRVVRMMDRRDNSDLVWTRVD
jgi:hypothetical protein